MKNIYFLILFNAFLISNAQVEWTGETITFSKSASTDWTQEANQDRITDNVWITRKNNQGIFNIAQETGYQGGSNISPVNTEWAFGSINQGVESLTFTSWDDAHGGNGNGGPASLIGQDMVLHLLSNDIYINIKFLSWGQGSGGGGAFSYERSTDQTLSNSQFESNKQLKLFPNPAKEYLQISGLKTLETYSIYSILGAKIVSGEIVNQEVIDIHNLRNGMYLLKFDNGEVIKFIKD